MLLRIQERLSKIQEESISSARRWNTWIEGPILIKAEVLNECIP